MAITLDSNLAAAQSLQERKPLCRIYSKENVDPIPFVGELLSTATPNEQYPAAKAHSTGRMFVAFMVDGSGDTLRYGYTDADRTYFTWVDFYLGSTVVGEDVSFCEMADAYVGIVWSETYGGTRSVKYRKISVTGANLSPAVTGTIFTGTGSAFFTGPSVEKLSDDTYLLAYGAMDGADYKLYKRTSSDFTTWSAAAAITLSGLTTTRRKANPALLSFAGGTVWLIFDYVDSIGPSGEELTNIYYVSSTDKLVTPSAPAALTSYTEYSERAEHPATAINAAGQVYLAFDRIMASLHMDTDTTGWCGSNAWVRALHVNATTQKLYITAYSGTLSCVVQVDLATWTIDDCWNTTTTPGFPAYYVNTGGIQGTINHSAGKYVAIGHPNGLISVLDSQADTITNYSFYDLSGYGIAQNVTGGPTTTYQPLKTWIDATANRIYVLLVQNAYWGSTIQVGYFDLTEAGPTFTFTTVLSDTSWHSWLLAGLEQGKGFFEVNADADLVIIGAEGWEVLSTEGCVGLYSLATGGLVKKYTTTLNPTFPKWGLEKAVYNDGILAGVFTYENLYGQADYRGLCLIDTATDVVTYSRPTWASVDDYLFCEIGLTDTGEYILSSSSYGVTLMSGGAWTLFSNATIPNLTPSGVNKFESPVAYNPTTRMIITGSGTTWGGEWTGPVMFSRDGYIKQSTYTIGTLSGSWSWSTAAPLIKGFTDYGAALAFDPVDDSLFAFWTNQAGTELSTKWGKALAAFDLTTFIRRGSTVDRFSTIDPHSGNWDAGITFEVTNGHLFDASNGVSLLRQYLAKGRKIEQQFGESIAGVQYWEPARIFTVSYDGELKYERGIYPNMKVECETPRRRWQQIHITASEAFNAAYPEDIIESLLEDYASELTANIQLGTWENRAPVEYQFVDVMLGDAVNLIAFHFGYAIRDGADGIIEAVKITNAGAISRTYSDNTKLIRATPRNRHSSFTNRWTVQCEERTFTELLMQESLAAEIMASHRWNTGSKTYRVNYTQGEKIFRNPRLEVVSSVASLAFQLAGSCSEALADNSHNEADEALWDTYCEIEVSSPDLTPAFIAALANLVASYFVPDLLNLSTETTHRVGSYWTAAAIFIALNILAATGNFQYRIYGQPVVKVRRTVQATADDLDMQTKMGQTIASPPYVDPLCGSAAECQVVADFLKAVGMAERARWSAERVADLHDEEGDTISVIHTFSAQALSIFVTDMKTKYSMPEAGSGTGGITQQIEGWRV